jgi:hypothetical protein
MNFAFAARGYSCATTQIARSHSFWLSACVTIGFSRTAAGETSPEYRAKAYDSVCYKVVRDFCGLLFWARRFWRAGIMI